MSVWHSQLFGLRLNFALIVDVGFGHLVLEEAFVVVPGIFSWSIGQALTIIRILNRFLTAALGYIGEERKVEALNRF